MKTLLLLGLSLFLSIASINAQSIQAEIIKIGQEKEIVTISNSSWLNSYKIRLSKTHEIIPIDSVVQITIDESVFIPKKVTMITEYPELEMTELQTKDTLIILERLVYGNLSLFHHYTLHSKDQFFIEKEGETKPLQYFELYSEKGYREVKNYQGVLNYLLQDCAEITYQKISNTTFRKNSLMKLVKTYNESCGTLYSYGKPDSKLPPFWGLSLGTTFYNIQPSSYAVNNYFNYFAEEDKLNGFSYSIGGLLGINLFRKHNKGKAYLNVNYSPQIVLNYDDINQDYYLTNLTVDGTLKFSSLDVNLLGEYCFKTPGGDWGIYARTGLSFLYFFEFRENVVKVVSDNPTFIKGDDQTVFLKSNSRSITNTSVFPLIGLGINYKDFYLGLDYLFSDRYFTDNGHDSSQRLIINLQYKIEQAPKQSSK
jgi:hypothetical protein